jgi:hypothetical protein
MYVTLQSSTCFEHQHAHLQEDKLYYHSIWYPHSLYRTVQYSMPDESSPLSTGILYSRLQRVTIQDGVIIQFVLLKMGMLMLETCRGL